MNNKKLNKQLKNINNLGEMMKINILITVAMKHIRIFQNSVQNKKLKR